MRRPPRPPIRARPVPDRHARGGAREPAPGPAVVALTNAVAHVRRHHLGPTGRPGTAVAQAAAMRSMLTLNLLSELVTLIEHAIAEVATESPSPPARVADHPRHDGPTDLLFWLPVEDHAAARAVDDLHHRLQQRRRAASHETAAIGSAASDREQEPAAGDMVRALATAVRLSGIIAVALRHAAGRRHGHRPAGVEPRHRARRRAH